MDKDDLLSEFIKTVFMTFVSIVFVTFFDMLSVTFIISSHTVTELSTIPFKYLLFWQIHVL